jgi:hypothetical protein
MATHTAVLVDLFFRGKRTALQFTLLTLSMMATVAGIVKRLNTGSFYANVRIVTTDASEVDFFIN